MKIYIIVILLAFGCVYNTFSQKDSLKIILKEVTIVADKSFKENSKGYKVISLTDSILTKNIESFSGLIRFNAPIYIREFGAGGTSSASFRGTSSSNTAVVWNGININSVNNGQTGFNSLTVSLFDNIDVRSGGGSIEYGSGAVGGTVHLNDALTFKNTPIVTNQFITSVGSYSTYNNLYKLKYSGEKLALKIGASYNQSENDYPLLGTNFRNTNGEYSNIGLNGGFSYKLSEYSELNLFTTSYLGERFFSGELPNPSSANDKYQDINNRTLITYHHKKGQVTNEVKAAFLTEEYRFFDDKTLASFNFGKSKRYIGNYKFKYRFANINASASSLSEYESVFGKTDQIKERNRRQFSQSLIFSHQVNNLLFYDVKLRKDFNSDYTVPLTYALGIKVTPFSLISFRANTSKNYRVPTYNDLFWPGQGNLNLRPETALQAELGVVYTKNRLKIDVAGFYIDARDKIVWTPNGDPLRPGIWTPVNFSKAINKGIEVLLQYKYSIGKHIIDFNSNYSYTSAKNAATNTFLIFVPKHLLNASLGYSYKKVSAFYQHLYTGKTYTTESNSEESIVPSFIVGNLGGDYILLKNQQKQLSIGFKINNIFNQLYFTQPRRPLQNRNYNFNINYKF